MKKLNEKQEKWLMKAYPFAAEKFKFSENANAAARHSFNKWLMIHPSTLKDHDLTRLWSNVIRRSYIMANREVGEPWDAIPRQVLSLSMDTCSLCQISQECINCPIVKVTGNTCSKAYDMATGSKGSIDPMLEILYKTAYYSFPKERPFCLWSEPFRPVEESELY